MKEVRRVVASILCVTASGGLFLTSGCDDRSVSQGQSALHRQYAKDYQRQIDIQAAQNAAWERQNEKVKQQDVRYEAILTKWEEHAARADVILDRFDKILGLLEERSRAR